MSDLGFIQDPDSQFRFIKISTTYELGKYAHVRIFHTAPLSDPNEGLDYDSQRYVPTETGIAIRSHF